jgi:indolepyruvate ferredoxin oxidoreductase
MDVAQLTHALAAFGVSRTIVVAENPDRLTAPALAANAKVYDRTGYEEAVRELGGVSGVTVLLYDQQCAVEKRRARKRGRQAQPEKYVFINEDVCEGCGDCGRVSNCMSVQPVETEHGRKTQIDQASCNNDYSCVNGDCPSFLTVYTAKGLRKKAPPDMPDDIPEPSRRAISANGYAIYMPGIGGTGVVTAAHVLSYAALMDGKHVHGLDQTGLAQKGGAVVSSLRIYEGDERSYASNKVGVGQADVVLAFDALGVVAPVNADRLSPGRTVVVGDPSGRATAEAVRHVSFLMPTGNAVQREVDRYSRAERNIWNDGLRMSDHLFSDHAFANIFLIGTAYQAGVIPISSSSIETAIRLNGVAVEDNIRAFRYGRLYFHDPSRVRPLLGKPARDYDEIRQEQRLSLGRSGAEYERLLERCSGLSLETQRILALRIGELISYQNASYAEQYVELVLAVAACDALVAHGEELTRAVAVNLYKLMAYKDEYEVARLLLKSEWSARIREQFVDPKTKFNLHPPLLRGRGLNRKLELGGWFTPFLRLLIPLRRLRGTRLDVFGRTEVRALERELIRWYADVVSQATTQLDADNYALAVDIASAPDRIRGYESLKVASADAVRRSVAESLRAMHGNRDVAGGVVSAGAAS